MKKALAMLGLFGLMLIWGCGGGVTLGAGNDPTNGGNAGPLPVVPPSQTVGSVLLVVTTDYIGDWSLQPDLERGGSFVSWANGVTHPNPQTIEFTWSGLLPGFYTITGGVSFVRLIAGTEYIGANDNFEVQVEVVAGQISRYAVHTNPTSFPPGW